MRNLNAVKALGLALCLCTIHSSCKNFEDFNEIDEVEVGGDYAIPLINSTASLQDILDDTGTQNDVSGLIIADDGSMKIEYKNSPIEKNISAFFEDIPSFPLVIPFNSNEFPFQFFEGVSVQQMNLSSGTLSFDLESEWQEDVDVLITIPNLTKGGVAFNISIQLNYQGNSPTMASTGPISLADYTLNLNDGMIEVYYQAVNSNGDNLQINPIMGMAENWKYDYLQGTWDNDTFNLSMDTLEIDIYDNWVDGQITFADPSLSLMVENSFGFPTMAKINELKVITTSGDIMYLTGDVFDTPLYLNYPSMMEPDASKETVITFNNTNSNIADILNAHPKQIIYSIDAIINPDNDPNTNGFMTDESTMQITLETELPIHGTASGFEIEEPLDSDLSDLENIEWAEFKIIADNGIPIDLGIQLYFTNEAGEKIDSLYSGFENLTEAATVDGGGNVISSTEKVTFIEVSADRMENIKQSNSLIVAATFSTADNGSTPVKILTNHELNLKVGLKVGVEE